MQASRSCSFCRAYTMCFKQYVYANVGLTPTCHGASSFQVILSFSWFKYLSAHDFGTSHLCRLQPSSAGSSWRSTNIRNINQCPLEHRHAIYVKVKRASWMQNACQPAFVMIRHHAFVLPTPPAYQTFWFHLDASSHLCFANGSVTCPANCSLPFIPHPEAHASYICCHIESNPILANFVHTVLGG